MPRAARIGLTGGIGSGKSTVASMLGRLGATIIDADAISRQCTAPQGAAMPAIRQRFGDAVIAADGGLDRAAMRQLAFSDSTARIALQDIVHPLVGLEIARQAQAAATADARCIVYDIPLLTEGRHWRARLQQVLVVDCSEATQIARVQARDGLPVETIQSIIASQSPRAYRLACADLVLCNEGVDLATLQQQVQAMAYRFGL